ncbi:MAG TPA: hypothetical protein VIQ00_02775 [Chitinophagaceae bacterium]|jgi:hypothetical protein
MKKILLTVTCCMALFILGSNQANAQAKAKKVKQTITSNAITVPTDEVDGLVRPENDKDRPKDKSRGDVYGADYSDIIIDNWTGYTIDVYVDGDYRGTIAAWDKKVTWAIPGNTKLYAKATFSDGSYLYWGPSTVKTGYEYTWKLNK